MGVATLWPLRKKRPTNWPLIMAGLLSTGIASIHLVAIWVGLRPYVFLAAPPDIIESAMHGGIYAGGVTGGVAVIFLIFVVYAFSGAGVI